MLGHGQHQDQCFITEIVPATQSHPRQVRSPAVHTVELILTITKPIANRCSPRIKWLIGAATGSGTSTFQEFNATKELNSELESAVDTNSTQATNGTEIDNRDFKKENDL